MIRKRWFFSLIGLLLAVTMLAACSMATEPPAEKEDLPAKAVEGGTLTIVRMSDAGNLDPHFISTINAASVVHQKVYEGLVRRDANMVIVPQLALSWRQVSDLVWEFKLRQGVFFHDGTPFDATAVKRTLDRVMDPKIASPRAAMFDKIKQIKIVDPYTVQFILERPFTPLLSILASHEGSMISPKAIEQYGRKLAEHPVGTGPFVFRSWEPGNQIVLDKNQQYWGDKPKIDHVIFRVVADDQKRIAMVENGEAHVAESIPVQEIDRLSASNRLHVYRSEALGTEFIGFNVAQEPLNDIRVRQAISSAIETGAIIKGVYNNVGTQANSPLGPKVFGYSASVQSYPYDLNKARELLAKAGYPNGFSIHMLTYDRNDRVMVAQVIRSQLKGIGIDAKMDVVSYADFVTTIEKTRTHQIFVSGWGNATGDADYNQYNLFHTMGGGAGNSFQYSNQELDKLLEAGRVESDPAKRLAIYAKAQELEMQDALLVPIRNLENLAVISTDIQGFSISPAGYLMLDQVSIQK
ncbi:glutathione ABC transporter substrate-binding protein [Brevibacillus parabrevis]|mgnify:FL=1|jgi:ABC-type dipeptide transport system, periplasmic component|uniref:glutathione ABC transporter substrate-binding protein n=1 Tax=Brevibacillus parabrevis TaxID=54914 RepID=UPI0024910A2A|nr:glutathione ABC transporter substrate-binding protein [Brevibacillus parabrevis]